MGFPHGILISCTVTYLFSEMLSHGFLDQSYFEYCWKNCIGCTQSFNKMFSRYLPNIFENVY